MKLVMVVKYLSIEMEKGKLCRGENVLIPRNLI